MRRTPISRVPAVAALLLGSALLTGCTLDPGRGFARLQGSLWSRFAGLDPSSGRLLQGGWFKTATSFELRLDQLLLEVSSVGALGAAGTAATTVACSFDPASPPAGCSLCHGGHCHCGDKLVSYQELEAQLCGSGGTAVPAALLASLLVAGPQSLLGEGSWQELSGCQPSCELASGSIQSVRLTMTRLQLSARLRDASAANRLGAAELAAEVTLAVDGASLEAKLPEPAAVGEEELHGLALAVRLPVAASLFDLEWQTLERKNGTVTVDAVSNPGAGEALLGALMKSPLGVTVSRKEE